MKQSFSNLSQFTEKVNLNCGKDAQSLEIDKQEAINHKMKIIRTKTKQFDKRNDTIYENSKK